MTFIDQTRGGHAPSPRRRIKSGGFNPTAVARSFARSGCATTASIRWKMQGMRARGGQPGRGEGGFSLVEALVALAIGAMLLATASEIYWHQREVHLRLAAQRAADEALE